ncbi:Uncharacterized protein Fot_06118 [Forsythia ovata]|uniref:Uncharacterized protein n=1 Tax=Forsythia ovata TaxID=205694 RepID=A0ABD1WS74_9LAMI
MARTTGVGANDPNGGEAAPSSTSRGTAERGGDGGGGSTEATPSKSVNGKKRGITGQPRSSAWRLKKKKKDQIIVIKRWTIRLIHEHLTSVDYLISPPKLQPTANQPAVHRSLSRRPTHPEGLCQHRHPQEAAVAWIHYYS